MIGREYDFQNKILTLREREKELRCLYSVEELIKKELIPADFFIQLVHRIPSGWQYPEICKAAVIFEDREYREAGWQNTEWFHTADIVVDQNRAGQISVYYTQYRHLQKDSPFLPEEQKLLNNIAGRIGLYMFNRRLQQTLRYMKQEWNELTQTQGNEILNTGNDEHWRWRMKMCEIIAEKTDMNKYGIKGIYVIGSTKNNEAGPASDIDLLIHTGNESILRNEFLAWLNGWSFCLSAVNYSKTGYKTDGLLDIHFITDEDIMRKSCFGVMLNSTENRAKPLRIL